MYTFLFLQWIQEYVENEELIALGAIRIDSAASKNPFSSHLHLFTLRLIIQLMIIKKMIFDFNQQSTKKLTRR